MKRKRLSLPFSSQNGFTLIELMLVIGIMGILIAIASLYYRQAKEEAADKQALVSIRNLLNEANSVFAEDAIPGVTGLAVGGAAPPGFPDLDMNPNTNTLVAHDNVNDIWYFYLGSAGGETAFYFWLPGPGCPLDQDPTVVAGNYAATIADDPAWRGGAFLNL